MTIATDDQGDDQVNDDQDDEDAEFNAFSSKFLIVCLTFAILDICGVVDAICRWFNFV